MRVFLSDAHIRTDESERGRSLRRFIHEVRPELTELYLLGDLFEFWFEYQVVFPKHYFKTLAVLYNLIEDGIPVHYVLGNHEVMIGDFLRNFGFQVHAGEVILDLEGLKVLVMHGHQIDHRLGTAFWQTLLTARFNHALYRLVHPDIGVFLAQGIAHLSRRRGSHPPLVAHLERYAMRRLQNVDGVIMGHSHEPALKRLDNGKWYCNTGDWITHYSYAVLADRHIDLRFYPIYGR